MLELKRIGVALGLGLLFSFLLFSVGISLYFALAALASYFGAGIFALLFVWFVIVTGAVAGILYYGIKL